MQNASPSPPFLVTARTRPSTHRADTTSPLVASTSSVVLHLSRTRKNPTPNILIFNVDGAVHSVPEPVHANVLCCSSCCDVCVEQCSSFSSQCARKCKASQDEKGTTKKVVKMNLSLLCFVNMKNISSPKESNKTVMPNTARLAGYKRQQGCRHVHALHTHTHTQPRLPSNKPYIFKKYKDPFFTTPPTPTPTQH